MRSFRRSLLLAALACAAVPSAASGEAIVSKPDSSTLLVQSTAPGEENWLDVTHGSGELVVTEAGVVGSLGLASSTSGCTQTDPTTVTCSATGIARVRVKGGPAADDLTSTGGVRRELHGETGNDALSGGAAGDLLVGGSGVDAFYGGSGNDRLDANDGAEDGSADCGDGDDDFDGDWDEPWASNCEVVAPELQGNKTLLAEPVFVGSAVNPDGQLRSNTPHVRGRWYRCSGPANCVVVQDEAEQITYVVTDADVNHTLVFESFASNRAGTATVRSNHSPLVQPRAAGAPIGGYRDPFPPPVLPTVDRSTLTRSLLAKQLGTVVTSLQSLTLRTLARRRRVTLAFMLPEQGTLDVALTITAKAARRYGVRSRKPVTLARGRKTGQRVEAVAVNVALTKHGRRIVGRAKSLDVTAALSLKTARPEAGPVKTSRRVKLRRR